MSCKLYLVPEDVINTWRAEQRASSVDKPVYTQVNRMDATLRDILDNKDVTDYEKEKLHSQELSKYMTMRQQPSAPAPPPANPDVTSLLASVPKMYKSKAKGLLEYLQSDRDIQWDDKGHVYIGNQRISESHIVDLINDAMRLRKKVSRPKGWRELSRHLQEKNVPKEFTGNPEWSEWSTPPESPTKALPLSKPSFVPYKKGAYTPRKTPYKKPERKSKIVGKQKIRQWTTLKDE